MTSTSPRRAKAPAGPEELRRLFQGGRHEFFAPVADWARREGRLEEALALLEEGLKRHPDRVSAWVLLARTKTQMGRLPEALADYRKILADLDPRNLPALRALAAAAIASGDLLDGQRYLTRWRHEDPEDPELEDFLVESELRPDTGQRPDSPESELPSVHDVGLAELEQKLLESPSPQDPKAWTRSARAGRRGT